MLSDSESDHENDLQLTINEHYANAYARKKEREELGKLKDKYGSDFEEMSGSDEESSGDEDGTEDEEAEELTPAMDAAILRTLARIRRKDPEIYHTEKNIFEEERKIVREPILFTKPKRKDSKPVTIKQQALSSMLNQHSRSPSPQPLTYEQEQQALRAEVISAFHEAVKDSGSDEEDKTDDLLIPREKGTDELEREEEEYREFLAREVGEDIRTLVDLGSGFNDTKEVVETGRRKRKNSSLVEDFTANSKQSADEEFLMNYILNRGWVDRDAKRIPTYKDITHKEPSKEEGCAQEDDEDFEEIADNFESSYNFRFEEPDGATIATFPRNLTSTVRRQDTKRKEARERRKERREEELNRKREEIKRLKALKIKELRDKLEKIEKEAGVELDSEALANFDLDGDWDPEKHDQQMAIMYEGDDDKEENEKPRWDNDIGIDDIQTDVFHSKAETAKKKKKEKEKEGSEYEFEMDADADFMSEEEWDGTEEMRKRKVQQYFDELHSMEFNDIVGGIPTRFSYAQVAPQTYGLTPDEILLATDAELNQYMGLKKLASYRKDRRNYDGNKMERLIEFRTKLKNRGSGAHNAMNGEASLSQKPIKKRKGKKERHRAKVLQDHQEATAL